MEEFPELPNLFPYCVYNSLSHFIKLLKSICLLLKEFWFIQDSRLKFSYPCILSFGVFLLTASFHFTEEEKNICRSLRGLLSPMNLSQTPQIYSEGSAFHKLNYTLHLLWGARCATAVISPFLGDRALPRVSVAAQWICLFFMLLTHSRRLL